MAREQTPAENGIARAATALRLGATAGVRRLGDFLIPPVCLSCHMRLGDYNALCAECWSDIQFIHPPVCNRLGLPLPFDLGGTNVSAAALASPPAYDRARVVAAYNDSVRALIHRFKYGDRHDGVALFGRWLAIAGRELLGDAELILPVPLNRWRLWRRRFNQAAVLARALSRETRIAHNPLCLKRPRATPSQVGLTRDQRRRNVAGAFALTQNGAQLVRGRRILLVDDVITTGATVEACTRTLKHAGAARVDVLALARVIDTTMVGV